MLNKSNKTNTVMKRTLNKILKLTLPLLYLLAGHRSIAQTSPMNMKQAIEVALANNYSLKADSMNLLVTDYQNKTLKADFLPQVSYSAKTEYNLAIPVQMIPGNIAGQPAKEFLPVQFGTTYNMGGGIEVTQSLMNKSSRIKINAAALNNSIAQSRHTLTKEELVYQVAAAFYALQANAELIRTTSRDYLNLKGILSIAKAQYEKGTLKRIDYESLEINTANKESYLNQLQTDYHDQLASFNYLLGIPAESKTIIDDSIRTISDVIEPGNLYTQREDINLSRQLIESKEVEIKSIRAEGQPTITSYFKFNYQSQFNDVGKVFNNDYWYKSSCVGITASISLFDGYRRKNRISVAQSQVQQLKFQEEQSKQLANTQWTTASETLLKDKQQFQITLRNLALAEKVFASRKALYTQGVTTLVELLDAESELSQSRNLHIQAMINVQTSLVNVYKAKGTLLTEFLKTI
jgi:outer membrane protein